MMFNNYYSPLEEDNEDTKKTYIHSSTTSQQHSFIFSFNQFDSIFLLQFDH